MTSTSVGWCEESFTEWTTSVPVATGQSPLQAAGTAASGSIPLLCLSPLESRGATSPHQPPHLDSCPAQSTPHSSSAPHKSDEEEEEEGRAESVWDDSPLYPDVQSYLLPRSSPVISRRHRPVSWHGGGASSNCSSPGSLSLDQPGRPTLGTDCPRPSSLQDNKHHRFSSQLNHLLTSLFHVSSGRQQGLAEEHVGQRPASCEGPPISDLSTKHNRHSCFPEFSADIVKMSCDVEKENAHFVVVDLVLEALEAVKWTLSDKQHTDTTDTHTQHNNRQRQGHTHRHTHADDQPINLVSTVKGSEDAGGDATSRTLLSAEGLAQRLVLEFKRSWLPSHEPRRGQKSLRSSLQELPGTGSVVAASGGSLTEEIRLRARMRGSLSWAPPRLQLIFTVQPTLRRSEVVASQHFLCAGCGTEVEPRYMKRLRYCEYLGRYFCECCHSGLEAVIPARVLSSWDFTRFPVSNFSKQLLDSVWFLPLFDLSFSQMLCSRRRELQRFRELLDQLFSVRKLLTTCRLSERVMSEFEQLPAHLVRQQPPLLSMDDLLRLRKGQLLAQVRAVVHAAISHVEECKLCLARGFICEFCREGNVIFPFQSDTCSQCPVCRTCFHKHCFVEKKCPKCSRIQSRRKQLEV